MYKLDFMHLFSVDPTIFKKKKLFVLPQKTLKKNLKSCFENLKSTIFLTAQSCQKGLNKRIMFQIAAYRPSVYKTEVTTFPFGGGIVLFCCQKPGLC